MSSEFERGFTDEIQKIAFTWYNPMDYLRMSGDIGKGAGGVLSSMAKDPWKGVGTVGGGLLGYHLAKQQTGSTLAGLGGGALGAYGGYQAGGALSDYLNEGKSQSTGGAGGFKTEGDLSADWPHKIKSQAAQGPAGPDMDISLADVKNFNKGSRGPKPKGPDMTVTPQDVGMYNRSALQRKPSSYVAANAPNTNFM